MANEPGKNIHDSENNKKTTVKFVKSAPKKYGSIFEPSASNIQISLTFRGVRYKQHPTAFPNQVPSFNPTGKEDLKWSMNAKTPLL